MEIKKCTCCNKDVTTHNSNYIGKMIGRTGDLYLFNCQCGTTLAKKVLRENQRERYFFDQIDTDFRIHSHEGLKIA